MWVRGYQSLDLVTDPPRMAALARHETERAPSRWRHRPVPGTVRTQWLYAHVGKPRPLPLDEPTKTAEYDGDDGMPPWATHLMLLITAEINT